jgi:hypothetical protein
LDGAKADIQATTAYTSVVQEFLFREKRRSVARFQEDRLSR